jgi:cell division septation protein DedD
MKMKFWNVRRVAAVLLSAFAANAFAQTMADAQKAYVAGNWKEAAAAYEKVCPTLADSAKTECYLWNVLALSQTGVTADFSKAGKRLDSLIAKTSPQNTIYSDLMMTKAQFQLYLGKHEKAAESLNHAIETAQPRQVTVLQKVCTAVQARVKNDILDSNCKKLNNPEAFAQAKPSAAVQPAAVTQPVVQTPEQVKPEPNPVKASAEPAKTVPEPATSTQKETWYLQLGAFGVKGNADLLVSNLKKRGITAKIEERPGETKTLYVVQTGDFDSKEKAIDFGAQKLAPLNVEFRAFARK